MSCLWWMRLIHTTGVIYLLGSTTILSVGLVGCPVKDFKSLFLYKKYGPTSLAGPYTRTFEYFLSKAELIGNLQSVEGLGNIFPPQAIEASLDKCTGLQDLSFGKILRYADAEVIRSQELHVLAVADR